MLREGTVPLSQRVKDTLAAWLLICNHLCPGCNTLVHGRILKYYGTNYWHIKMVFCAKEPPYYHKGQGRTCRLNVICNHMFSGHISVLYELISMHVCCSKHVPISKVKVSLAAWMLICNYICIHILAVILLFMEGF